MPAPKRAAILLTVCLFSVPTGAVRGEQPPKSRPVVAIGTAVATNVPHIEGPEQRRSRITATVKLKFRYREILDDAGGTLTDEDRTRIAEVLRDAEGLNPPPFDLLCHASERLGRFDDAERFARRWIETEGDNLAATAALVSALKRSAKPEAADVLKNVLDRLERTDGLRSHETLERELLTRGEFAEAVRTFRRFRTSPGFEPLDELLFAHGLLNAARQTWKLRANDALPEASAAVADFVEAFLLAHLAADAKDQRLDMLRIVLDGYQSSLRAAGQGDRGIEFLTRLDAGLDRFPLSEEDRAYCRGVIADYRLRVLFQSGRRAEASQLALAQLRTAIETYRSSAETDVSGTAYAFATAFLTVETGDVAGVIELFRQLGLEDFEAAGEKFITSRDPDADPESERQRVGDNLSAWFYAQQQYFARLVGEGRVAEARSVAMRLQKIPRYLDREGEFVVPRDGDLYKSLRAFSQFAAAVTSPPSRFDAESPAPYVELQRERWFGSNPLGAEALRGKAVLILGGIVGSRPELGPPQTLDEIKIAIDQHLGEEGLDGSGPELWSDPWLGDLYDRRAGDGLAIITVVDDDYDSQFDDGTLDHWHPEPPDALPRMLRSIRVGHPVVYSWQSKYFDALCSDGWSFALLYDRDGKLRRVVPSYPLGTEFESLEESIDRLLNE